MNKELTYVPLHCHCSINALDNFGTQKSFVDRAKGLGLPALITSDHGNIAGHLSFINECNKAKIKPILGVELYLCNDNPKTSESRYYQHMVVWAKNKTGWKSLMKLVNQTNQPDCFYYRPRITLFNGDGFVGLESFLDGNIQGFSGHQGSYLANNLFTNALDVNTDKIKEDIKKAYAKYKEVKNPEFYRQFLKENWLDDTCQLALKIEKIFGKGNFFIEIQNEFNPDDQIPMYVHPVIVECLREVAKKTGIAPVASCDSHYSKKEDSDLQKLMLMIQMKETDASIAKKIEEDEDTMGFFGSKEFYIHSYEEMATKYTPEELENTVKIAEGIEVYDIKSKPIMPKFVVPQDVDLSLVRYDYCKTEQDKFLIYLCLENAAFLEPWKTTGIPKEKYFDRMEEEWKIFFSVGLTDYFLMVWDMCKAADLRPKDHSFDWYGNLKRSGPIDPIARGVGRGSVGGCLSAYFMEITGIDSLAYDLSLSRFYNAGRNSGDHIEYPDIDTDFSVEGRDWIIEYLKWKYGKENVSQIVTFQRMQGKAALKDVFRVRGIENGFELANKISDLIPNESEISDELQVHYDAGDDEYGLIQYAIDNNDKMKEYYERPDLKPLFDQAMRCEGTKRGSGRHPAGVVITPNKVYDTFPMTYDPKSKELIIGVDMNDIAKLGGIKMDILGTAVLDKMQMVQNLVNRKV